MEKSRGKLYGKALIIFFAVVAICTIISRIADSMTIPRVKVQKAKAGKITYQMKGKGEVETTTKSTYLMPNGFLVESCLENGTSVNEGDVLIQFQKEQLEKKREELQGVLEQAQIQLEQAKLSQQEDAWVPEEENAQKTLNQAQAEYNQALAAKQQAQDNYNQVLATMNPEEEGYKEKQEELEGVLTESESRLSTATQSLSQAQQSLEGAKKNDEVTRQNNAKAKKTADYTVDGAQLSVEEAERNLKVVEDLIAQEGKICAAEKGIFQNKSVTAGTLTSGSEFISIGTGGMVFSAEVPKEAREKLAQGDSISIKIPGQEEIKAEITQIALKKSKEENSSEDVVWLSAVLPENMEVTTGYASFSIVKESEEKYQTVLPLTAIHQDNNGYYCLGIRNQNSILGEETKAERIPIKILDKDDTQAAIEGAIQPDSKIIVSSEKSVLAGDRVRVEE